MKSGYPWKPAIGLAHVSLRLLVLHFALGTIWPLPSQVVVEIQNLAGVPASTVAEMKSGVAHSLRVAEITVAWRNEDSNSLAISIDDAPTASRNPQRRIHLRLATSRTALSRNPGCLGEAVVVDGRGSLAIVYLDRVRAFASKHRLPVGRVLGYAASHEIGHLLVGTSEHSEHGLMRAQWTRREADAMRTARLHIDHNLAERMLQALESRRRAPALADGSRPHHQQAFQKQENPLMSAAPTS